VCVCVCVRVCACVCARALALSYRELVLHCNSATWLLLEAVVVGTAATLTIEYVRNVNHERLNGWP
jgi:hypothetical protein